MSSFKGEFVKSTSTKLGLPIVSFVLTNNNLFFNETINILIMDSMGTKQFPMRMEVRRGISYVFNIDTISWDWAQNDLFSIVDNGGKVVQQWQCKMPEFEHTSCPHCHGSKKCRACNGEGVSLTANYQVITCSVCGGTGICQYCYIPTRSTISSGISSNNLQGLSPTRRVRPIATIQGEIRKTEFELARVNKLLLDYELRQDYGTFYLSQQRYKLSLEHKIRDLYDEMGRSM